MMRYLHFTLQMVFGEGECGTPAGRLSRFVIGNYIIDNYG